MPLNEGFLTLYLTLVTLRMQTVELLALGLTLTIAAGE